MVNMGNPTFWNHINSLFYHTFSLKSIELFFNHLRFAVSIKKEIMSTERKISAFLEITMKVNESDRAAAASVYTKYRQPFLETITGAVSKQLLVRQDDVQVLHGFTSLAEAEGYLKSDLFNQDVVVELKPFFQEAPNIKIYSVVG